MSASAQNNPPTEKQWRLLLAMSRTLAVTMDIDALLKKVAETAVALLECDRASVFLHDDKTSELWTTVALQSEEIRIPDSSGIAGAAFTSNQVVLVQSTAGDERFNKQVDRDSGYTTRNLLAAPMIDIDGKPIGVIQALNRNSGTFSEADIPLIQLLADNAGVAAQRHRLQLQAMEAAAMRHEMEMARGLQQSLLPKSPPQLPGIVSAAWAATASLTGGDAYDLWAMPDGSMGVFLADAAGHGLPPAFVVSQVRAMIRALSEESKSIEPDSLLTQLNYRITQDFAVDRFVTAFLARVSADGKLEWCSAGHGPVFLSTSADAPFRELDTAYLPLGIDRKWDPRALECIQLGPGAMLVAPSDGMFEAFDRKGEAFGTDRLLGIISANRHLPPVDLVDHVRRAVYTWTDGQDATDDQTLVIVRWAPHPL